MRFSILNHQMDGACYCVGIHSACNRDSTIPSRHSLTAFTPPRSDLKPDNILLTSAGTVKLADFGHAARFPDGSAGVKPQHHEVVTIWYRAPELLFRSRFHGPAVDMWSVGCILAELLLRQPLFPAQSHSDRDQAATVFRLLGTPIDSLPPVPDRERAPPSARQQAANSAGTGGYSIAAAIASVSVPGTETRSISNSGDDAALQTNTAPDLPPVPVAADWPGCTSLPGYAEFEQRGTQPWREVMRTAASTATPLAVDLLARMLSYDPASRISASDALRHPWFGSSPAPTPPAQLPLPASARLQAAFAKQASGAPPSPPAGEPA